MTMRPIGRKVLGLVLTALAVTIVPQAVRAQNINLNYDVLSSLEEPIAVNIGEITFQLTGLIDAPLVFDLSGDTAVDNVKLDFVGNFQISAQTLLPNRWRLGAAYFGQYATDSLNSFEDNDEYSDNVAAFIGTSFGTILGGNVGGQVREQTRRRRGTGNGFLAFENFFGGLDNWGGAYVGRFGPVVLSGSVDENGNFELGGSFQRPIGRKDYRISLRLADGRFVSQDGITTFDTKGVAGATEFVYGSSLFDLSIGYERLESPLVDVNRWFFSGSARTKLGPLALSAEAHYGETARNIEKSAALGASYDIARGMTANLGINYEEANISAGNIMLVSTDAVQGLASLRFTF